VNLKLWIEKNISSQHLLFCGILVVVSFLFQSSVTLRCIQAAGFVILASVSGKKIRIVPLILMFSGIVIINLLRPYGKLLFSVFSFNITQGALETGINKASTLVGLIYLSRFFVQPGLRIPGKTGWLLGRVFYYFEEITEKWKLVSVKAQYSEERPRKLKAFLKTFINSLDRLLFTVYPVESPAPQNPSSTSKSTPFRTTLRGYCFLGVLLLLNYLPLVLPLLL